jgi:hypothetical protein
MLCPSCQGFATPREDKNLCHNLDCEQYGRDITTGKVVFPAKPTGQPTTITAGMAELLRDCHDGKATVHAFAPPLNPYVDVALPHMSNRTEKDAEVISQGGTQFETGAVRSADKNGVMYHLITPIGLRRIAETYREGFDKYGAFNWERGMPIGDILNHAIAHIFAYLSGEPTGEDDLAHAAWNLLAAMHMEETHPNINHQLRFPIKERTNEPVNDPNV